MARHRWATAGDRTGGVPEPGPDTLPAATTRLQHLIDARRADDETRPDDAYLPLDEPQSDGGQADAPQAPRRRWVVGRRAAFVCCGVLLVWGILLVVGQQSGTGQTGTVALDEPTPTRIASGSTSGSAAAPAGASEGDDQTAAEPAGMVIVHVTGSVRKPGIVRLPAGSRAYEAIAKAGGATESADPSAVNLAAKVEDGSQLHLPEVGEAVRPASDGGPGGGGSTAGTGSGAAASGGPINLNTATAAELDTLPRVGPVLADRIVQWREDHGKFTQVEDLDAVPGIGPAMMAALADLVAV